MTGVLQTARGQPTGRVVFVDQARALALTLMLVGHSLDRFLGEPWRSGELYQQYQLIRGLSSALFLLVSGFSFVIASFNHFEAYTRLSPRLWARARRIGLILFLGYVLHLFAPTLTQSLGRLDPGIQERFLRFDILQNIGLGLLVLHGIAFVARTPRRFWKATLMGMLIILALGRWTYLAEVDGVLPVALGTMVNLFHQSRFPVVPYTAYMMLGALLGCLFYDRQKSGDQWKVMAGAAGLAVFLIGFEQLIRNGIPGGLFPYATPEPHMPGNVFVRAAMGLLTMSGLYAIGRKRVLLPRLSFVLSKEALSIFFVHLLLVYGGAVYPSLFASRARAMTPAQVFVWIIGLFTAMAALGGAISQLRARRPRLLAMGRHGLILGGLLAFGVWPELSAIRIGISLAAAFGIARVRETTQMRDNRSLPRSALPG